MAQIRVQDGMRAVPVTIVVAGRQLRDQLNPKTVRRCQRTMADFGLGNVAVVLQAKLEPKDVLTEAGLTVQPKGPQEKAAPPEAAP